MPGSGIGVTPRVAKVTIAQWTKRLTDQALNRFVWLSILQSKGRVKRKKGGGQLRWPVLFDYHELNPHVDFQASEIARFNGTTNAYLPWGKYEVTDAVTTVEKAENGGEPAMVKVIGNRIGPMRQSFMQRFGSKLYVDGPSLGNNEFHGLLSLMGINTGAQVATDVLATTLNDSYAGLSTVKGELAGSNEFEPGYDAWSPVVVNANRQNSGGATRDWDLYADEYIRDMLLQAAYGNSEEQRQDLVLLRRDSYKALLNILDDKERVTLTAASEFGAHYGFKHTKLLMFDGAGVTWDAGVPATSSDSDTVHGFGLNTDAMELCLLDPAGGKGLAFLERGRDPYRSADLFKLICLGQFKFESPRHFGMLAEITA